MYLLSDPGIPKEVWAALAEAESALPAPDVVPVILSPGSRKTRRYKAARNETPITIVHTNLICDHNSAHKPDLFLTRL